MRRQAGAVWAGLNILQNAGKNEIKFGNMKQRALACKISKSLGSQ